MTKQPHTPSSAPGDGDPDRLGTTMQGSSVRHSVETLIGRAAVERGLATRDQVLAAFEVLKAIPREERAARFADVFVSRGVLTSEQIETLRGWVTEDPSSASKSGSGVAVPKVSSADMIPGFRLEKKLGAGAMGVVWLARQLSLDRLVAIKLLGPKFAKDKLFIDRFYKEGRAAARLNDPNIVAAYDVNQTAAGLCYFVMEYVDGETVYDRIKSKHRIPEREALHIIRQAASALRHAHETGFIHRDVKPKNLMINRSGVVKLADLGLARGEDDSAAAAEEKGKIFGTPYYISPEQIRARSVTAASDIYGLGATLYHMVTGRVPFDGPSPSDVMQKHLRTPLVPPDQLVPQLSSGLSMVVEMMMAKDPRERYSSAVDLIEDLDRVQAGESPVHARPKFEAALSGAGAAAAGEGTAGFDGDETFAAFPQAGSSRGPAPWSSPMGIALLVGLGVSLAANAAMALLLLVRR
jgi:serine/threonine-protein kinase